MPVPEPYDWIIRFSAEVLLIFIFALVLLPALWKLVMSRPGLIIVFSRAFGNFCHLFADLPNFVYYNMLLLDSKPLALIYLNNTIILILAVVQHSHNLALALNRANAMFFPFHYKFVYSKKRNVFLICLFLWLLAIPFAVSDQILTFFKIYTLNTSPTLNLTKYCMYAAGLVYAAIGFRMLWMKYKTNSVAAASAENDMIKILVVCFSCLAMSAIYQLVMHPYLLYFNNSPYIVQRIAVWAYNCSYLLGFCTEEICLGLLVRDFRKHLKQQLRPIFGCFGKLKNKFVLAKNSNATSSSSTMQPQTAANSITVVNSSIVRVSNALNTHPRTKTF